MKQFPIIFRYEYNGMVRSKVFVIMTIIFAVIIAITFSLPTIIGFFSDSSSGDPSSNVSSESETDGVVAISNLAAIDGIADDFAMFAPQYKYVITNESEDAIKEKIDSAEYKAAVIIDTPVTSTYIVQSSNLTDYMSSTISEVLKYSFLKNSMLAMGATPETAAATSMVYPSVTTVETGGSFIASYIFAYAMVYLLFMCIMMYGQLVATSVVTEKSSRAMELLITTTNPTSLMFGKVFGVGLAGLTQMAVFMFTGILFFRLNSSAISAIPIFANIAITPMMIVNMFIFFMLGFFMYAFLFGALGSTITRMEEMNTSVLPIMLLFMIALVISFSAMSTDTNTPFVTVMSFIPFFSPMVMYTRICMAEVPTWQILTSIVLMCATVVGTGYIAAKIYKVGVLMYGKPPKLLELVKVLRGK